mmetsp:Transcript_28721/g.77322  ORF Transcript_28721/g.77322 Transcript_28721/m.77322 type:complete len:234 (+) Transcript_28721:442-1143(+)
MGSADSATSRSSWAATTTPAVTFCPTDNPTPARWLSPACPAPSPSGDSRALRGRPASPRVSEFNGAFGTMTLAVSASVSRIVRASSSSCISRAMVASASSISASALPLLTSPSSFATCARRRAVSSSDSNCFLRSAASVAPRTLMFSAVNAAVMPTKAAVAKGSSLGPRPIASISAWVKNVGSPRRPTWAWVFVATVRPGRNETEPGLGLKPRTDPMLRTASATVYLIMVPRG